MAKAEFPKTIYLAREQESDGTTYFIEYHDVEDLHERDGEQIGIYQLVDRREVSVKVDVSIEKKTK